MANYLVCAPATVSTVTAAWDIKQGRYLMICTKVEMAALVRILQKRSCEILIYHDLTLAGATTIAAKRSAGIRIPMVA